MKTNTNLILQHMLWRGLYFLSVLFLNIAIARFFAAEKSGQLFYIVNSLAFVILIASFSLESGSTYFIASGKLNVYPMARFCGIWALTSSVIAVTGWAAVLFLIHSGYLNESGFLTASFLFILGVLLTSYYTALFYAKKEFSLPNKILLFVNAVLLFLLVLGKNQHVIRNHFIDIYFSGFFVQGLLLMLFFFRGKSFTEEHGIPSRRDLRKVFKYSLAALMANGIYFLVNRIDFWFVEYFCTKHDLGNYIQASKLAQMLVILPGILGASLFPIFSSDDKSGKPKQLASVMRLLFFINGGICFCLVCFGWYLIPVLFGPSFDEMYLLFVLLIPGVLCVTLNYPLTAWFSANNRIAVNIKGSLLALLLICIGDFILLRHYSVLAASVVSSIGYLSYLAYTINHYRKDFPVPWSDFFIINKSDVSQLRQSIAGKLQDPALENPIV